jgi:hypothetical protein
VRAAAIPALTLMLLLAYGSAQLGFAAISRFGGGEPPKTVFGELRRVVEEHAGTRPILVLSTSVYPAFPLVNATGAGWSSRYWALWLLPGLYSPDEKRTRPFPYRARDEMDDLERELIDNFVEDMLAAPPALLIVDRLARKQGFPDSAFDFLTYLRRDPRFAQEFGDYRRLTDVGSYRVYRRTQPAG